MQGQGPLGNPNLGQYSLANKPATLNDEGYLTNCIGTVRPWEFQNSAGMLADTNLNTSRLLSVTNVPGVPTYPQARKGSLAFNTVANVMYVFDGTTWNPINTGGADSLATVLAVGNITGANNIVISSPQQVIYANSGIGIGASGLVATTAAQAVSIGESASAAAGGTSIGAGAITTADGVAVGHGATTVAFTNAMALGAAATCTANNQVMMGIASQTVTFPGAAAMPSGVAAASTALLSITSGVANPTSAGVAEGALYFNSFSGVTFIYGSAFGWAPIAPTTVPSWASVLTAGSSTGATSPIITTGQTLLFQAGVQITTSLGAAGATNATGISVGTGASGNASNAISIGNSSTASNPSAIALGQGSTASSSGTVAIGNASTAAGANSVAIGPSATTVAFTSATALGTLATATANNQITLGTSLEFVRLWAARFATGVSVGGNNTAAGTTNATGISIGSNASGNANNAVAIGSTASVSAASGVAIGINTTVTTASGIAIGVSSTVGGVGAIALGPSATGGADQAVAIGQSSVASGTSSVAIGSSATASTFTTAVALGSGATSTANNQITFGTSAEFVRLWAERFATGISIGGNNTAAGTTNASGTSIGASAAANAANAVCIGTSAATTGSASIAIGNTASASTFTTAVALGAGATSTANNQITFGTSAEFCRLWAERFVTGVTIGSADATAGTTASTGCSIMSGATASTTNSIAIGISATATAATGSCIAIGPSATASGTTTAASKISIGNGATSTTNSISHCIAIGTSASCNSADAICIGRSATIGTSNDRSVAIGLSSQCQGSNAVAIGNVATASGTGVAIGTNTVALAGVCIGGSASLASAGNSCIAIGPTATVTGTGASNVVIGASATTAASNCTVLGAGAVGTVSNGLFFQTGLGTAAAAVAVSYDTATGRMYPNSSSKRYKENIEDFNDPDEKILDLVPRKYTYKDSGKAEVGLIAEEVFEHVPSLVYVDPTHDNRPEAVHYDRLGVHLIPMMKKIKDEIFSLQVSAMVQREEIQKLQELVSKLSNV